MSSPENYDPGELDKTRKNIGPITESEAKLMAEKLGGEIGVERSDQKMEQKYTKLKEKQRRRSDILGPEKFDREVPSYAADESENHLLLKTEQKISRMQQIKINFLAARPEHQLKTKFNALMSVFSFFTPVRDSVHPVFISHGDKIFYYQIEQLVMSVRNLLSRNKKNKVLPVKNYFYLRILNIIKNWDIAGINSDLSMLQKSPRNVLFSATSSLTRKIYRPILMLHELHPSQHIIAAIRDLHEKTVKTISKKSPEIDKLNKQFMVAKDSVYNVFVDLKKALYPMLLKHVGKHFNEFETFFHTDFTKICLFLGISADDFVQPEEEHFTPPHEEKKKTSAEPDKPEPVDIGIQIGFQLLDEMFPEAGWKNLEKGPDMYPYFSKILVFPKDMEILPPGDPLQYIVILVKIIQELLHGFRAVELNDLQLSDTIHIELSSFLEEITRDWHLFIDETIEKQYLPRLRDFCRQMERAPSFKHSDYGNKIISTLLWMKRKLVVPYYSFNDKMYSKPSITIQNAKLFEQVSYASSIFSRVLADLNKDHPRTIANPNAEIEFEIEHPVSSRLLYTLTQNKKKHINRNLMLYTTSIIMTLDFLLNDNNSPLYQYEAMSHFRYEPENEDIPEYMVSERNVFDLWAKYDKEKYKVSNKDYNASEKSVLEGYLHSAEMQDYIKKLINEFHDSAKIFCLLITRLPIDHDISEILEDTTREMQDITFYSAPTLYYILLPDTAIKEADMITKRIMEKAVGRHTVKPAIVSIEYNNTWGSERMMNVINKCDEFLSQTEERGLWIYNYLNDQIQQNEI